MSSETASVHLATYSWLADTNRFCRTDVKNKNLQICLKAERLFPQTLQNRPGWVLRLVSRAACCTSSVISSVSDSSRFYSAALLKPLINNSSGLHSNRPGDGSCYSDRVRVFPHRPRSGRACWTAGRSALCRWSGARTPCRGRGRRWRISAASRTTADRTGPWCRRQCAWGGDRYQSHKMKLF